MPVMEEPAPTAWVDSSAAAAPAATTALTPWINNGELGINSGTLVLSNLTAGATYNVLFLAADTRSGVGTRTYSVSFGGVTSPSQSYAFPAGSPSLARYILCTFTATGPDGGLQQ